MHMIDLDGFDLRLLGALQANGALTNQELAGMVGLSASQISRRRGALEQAGVISGYAAQLSPAKLGIGVAAYVNVTLATHSPDNSRKFGELIARTPEIMAAHAVTGSADYLLKVAVRTLADLSSLLNDVLLPHPSVERVRSEIVLETLKDTTALPL
jgi:DNA-binding Lrp family transcriptional regulator